MQTTAEFNDTRFRGWKEIADYLKVDQQTARKYHKELGMPIVRVGRTVIAYASEIKRWEYKRK